MSKKITKEEFDKMINERVAEGIEKFKNSDEFKKLITPVAKPIENDNQIELEFEQEDQVKKVQNEYDKKLNEIQDQMKKLIEERDNHFREMISTPKEKEDSNIDALVSEIANI